MNRILKLVGCMAFTCMISACTEKFSVSDYQIIPIPQEIIATDNGEFALEQHVKILYPEGNAAMQRNAVYLATYLKNATGYDFQVETGTASKGNIILQLAADSALPESYHLSISKDGIIITGGDEAGVFYGIQTLRKSIPVKQSSIPVLAAIDIKDSPRFGYRGVHLDVSRHFFTTEEVKTFIDMMTLHNMNRLHWHLTDDQGWRIEIKKYPQLTKVGANRKETMVGHNSSKYDGVPYGGFYTQEDLKEIVKYAAERYITVIPEIDLPGHMQAALAAYPQLGCTGGPYEVWRNWGISEDVLCAGNDDVLSFIDNVLTEVMEIFPSEYIHIGGDECPKVRWIVCKKCQKRISELGLKSDKKHTKEEYLQSFIINHAEKTLNQNGRQMIGWDEILEGELAPNATVMSWRGEQGGIEAARQRHDVIMTPNTYLYFDYYQSKNRDGEPEAIGGYLPVEHVYSYEPIPNILTLEEQKHIIGVQANHWTEYIPSFSQLQYMALPRWAALCEIQWSRAEKKNYVDFLHRLPQLTKLYETIGYNYAKHVFEIEPDFQLNMKDNTLQVILRTMDNAPVHFTLDGTEPTMASQKAEGAITISETTKLKAVTIRTSGINKTLRENIYFSKATCKPIAANLPINKQYEFKGVTTLVDGLKGNKNYNTGRWIAFKENEMDVTIDLGQTSEFSTVSFSTCVNKEDWVFDARSAEVEISDNGNTFTKVFEETYPKMKSEDSNGVYEHHLKLENAVKTRYVRIRVHPENSIPAWHDAKGNRGLMFVDEIMLE